VVDGQPTISTHVLDTAAGAPRPGLRVRLWRSATGEEAGRLVAEAVTDADGRIRDLLAGSPLEAGSYRLEFVLDEGGFFTGASIAIRIDDPSRGYHVPLLLAPFGLTTYRGS
jgi:5-hydroxyisourate hydrolase